MEKNVSKSADEAVGRLFFLDRSAGRGRREKTKTGCRVSTSLIAEGTWAASAWVKAALDGAKFTGVVDREHPPNALANMYQTLDDRWLLLAMVQEDKEWPAFATAIGQPGLIEEDAYKDSKSRKANASSLVQILDKVFVSEPLDYWRIALDKAHITFGVVQSVQELIHGPQCARQAPCSRQPPLMATDECNKPVCLFT